MMSVFIAMTDQTEENGAVYAWKGSHVVTLSEIRPRMLGLGEEKGLAQDTAAYLSLQIAPDMLEEYDQRFAGSCSRGRRVRCGCSMRVYCMRRPRIRAARHESLWRMCFARSTIARCTLGRKRILPSRRMGLWCLPQCKKHPLSAGVFYEASAISHGRSEISGAPTVGDEALLQRVLVESCTSATAALRALH